MWDKFKAWWNHKHSWTLIREYSVSTDMGMFADWFEDQKCDDCGKTRTIHTNGFMSQFRRN